MENVYSKWSKSIHCQASFSQLQSCRNGVLVNDVYMKSPNVNIGLIFI